MLRNPEHVVRPAILLTLALSLLVQKTSSQSVAEDGYLKTSAKPLSAGKARDISFEEAKLVLETFSDELPADLKGIAIGDMQKVWPQYVRRQDSEVRRRLLQGDEDSLVNLLLFGTSFTRQPRLTDEFVERAEREFLAASAKDAATSPAIRVLEARTVDMARALAAPGSNERLAYMRHFLEQRGFSFQTAAAREKVREYLATNVQRVRREFLEYHRRLEAAHATGDPSAEFAVRSTLFQRRGISLDTSLMPDYALEQALKLILNNGVLKKGSIRRVAVVGPGLDFTDKQEGYDFYPQQTTQPFALIDSLLRTGLSGKENLQLDTLDISSRVNRHLASARQRARQGSPYTVQLPLSGDKAWDQGAKAFWEHLGEFIGSPTKPVTVPETAGKLDIRAVRIPADVVLQVIARDMNVVWQRLDLPAGQQYDLVVATNVLVYYDEFEQALALDNLQSMIRENGFLLSNNGLPEVPALKMKQIGHSSTAYSDRTADGDHIIWYQHSAK